MSAEIYLSINPLTAIKPHTAIPNQPEESKQKDGDKKKQKVSNVEEQTCWRLSLKIGLVILLLMRSSCRAEGLLRGKGWLTDVGHNSWWHIKCAQHAAQNSKRRDFQTSSVMVLEEIKWPACMVKGGHRLREIPQTSPIYIYIYIYI